MHHTDMDKAKNAINDLFQGREECIDREQIMKFTETHSDVLHNLKANKLTKDCYRREELLQEVQGLASTTEQGTGQGGRSGTIS